MKTLTSVILAFVMLFGIKAEAQHGHGRINIKPEFNHKFNGYDYRFGRGVVSPRGIAPKVYRRYGNYYGFFIGSYDPWYYPSYYDCGVNFYYSEGICYAYGPAVPYGYSPYAVPSPSFGLQLNIR